MKSLNNEIDLCKQLFLFDNFLSLLYFNVFLFDDKSRNKISELGMDLWPAEE